MLDKHGAVHDVEAQQEETEEEDEAEAQEELSSWGILLTRSMLAKIMRCATVVSFRVLQRGRFLYFYIICVKMADIVVTTNCSSPRFSNNSSINEVHNCKKCAEVEIQLQQVLKDRSTQLIIQMLKKESMPEDATTSNQLAKSDLCTADEWEVKITKGNKG